MKNKFVALLGASLIVSALSICTGCANAREIVIEGAVTYGYSGQPVAGASVVFTQLHGVWYAKPRPLGKVITDKLGRYRMRVTKAKGTIDIMVPASWLERCGFSGAVAQIDVGSIKDEDVAGLNLSIKKKLCSPD